MLKRIVQLGERAIDAYARAIALSTRQEQQEGRAKMLTQVTQLYKSFHNGSDEGLNELIAGVLAKPLPE
jgi:DNA-binding ferritin-like protein